MESELTGLHFVDVDAINNEIKECQERLDKNILAKSKLDFVMEVKLTERIKTLRTVLANCKSVKKAILKENYS